MTAEYLPFFLACPLIYLTLVALGRWMKRWLRIPLGFFYQLLCIVLALYLPMLWTDSFFELGRLNARREMKAVLLFLGTLFGLAVFSRFYWDGYFRRRKGLEAPRFLREVVALLVTVAAVLAIAWGLYDRGMPGVLAGSGIAAIILGLALQDLLGNVISGIALEIGRPFRPGDWLKVDEDYGQVIDINWRAIRLKTNDDIMLEIPNSTITKTTIVNLTAPARAHAIRLEVGLEYGAAPNLVKDILVHAAQNTPGVLTTPAPRAYLKEFGDSAVIYQIKFYMEDHRLFNSTRDGIYTSVWYELRRAGLTIPFPIRTLQIAPRGKPAEPRAEALRALRAQPLFLSLEEGPLRHLVASARTLCFGREEVIIEEGTPGESMFILLAGEAEVSVSTSSGGKASVGSLTSGDCFGEMSLLTGENRSATVTAREDCEVLEIQKPAFRDVLEENPDLLTALGDLLAERRLQNEETLSQVPNLDKASRKQEYARGFLTKLSFYFGL